MKFTFRLLNRLDFPLFATWLGKQHIQRWWHEQATVKHVEEKYGPSVDGTAKTTIYIIEADTIPIGMIQIYWLRDYPDHVESVKMSEAVGIDLFIGDPRYVGKGYGSVIISTFVNNIVKDEYSKAVAVIADPSIDNFVSVRTFEKTGFKKGDIVKGEDGLEQLMILQF